MVPVSFVRALCLRRVHPSGGKGTLPNHPWKHEPVSRQRAAMRRRRILTSDSDCFPTEEIGNFRYRRAPSTAHLWSMKKAAAQIAPATTRMEALDRIKTAMVEKKLTQAELADAADCHEKTIQNLLGGRSVRDQTLFDVCMVLGLDFHGLRDAWHGETVAVESGNGPLEFKGKSSGGIAPIYMGAYSQAAVDHYIGSYLTLRRSFSLPDTIVAYRTDISWDPEWPSLLFQERDRPDAPYAHRGRLYIPASSSFIHLVSLTKGAMRMVVVSQLDRAGEMRGIITTLNKQRANLIPVATAILYAQRQDFDAGALGEVTPKSPAYAEYKRMLDETVAEGYAKLVG
jgi:hypothetical protein